MTLPTLGAAATAWLWEKFGSGFAQKLAKDIWATFNWAAAALRYRKHLRKQYSTIHIFGMSGPVPLEGVFTDVVTLDKPADRHRYDIAALQEEVLHNPDRIHALMRQRIYSETKRVDGCELVRERKNDRLFILGKPGAGKTTFLKYLALQAAQGDLNQIPIFVRLREWKAEGDLLAFLARQFEICGFPEATPFIQMMLQHTDYGLVLFDGLDEIPQEGDRRARAIGALRDFARQYPRAQVLITCRNAASDVTFEGFKYVEIADFQEGQMVAFVRKWFKAAKAPEVAERFWKAFNERENRGIRELGSQPLLLTLLCLTYQETRHFPQRHVEIYEEALQALLSKWDSSRQVTRDTIYKNLSLGRKRQLFARLAATFFDRGIYFIPQRELVDEIARYVEKLPAADKQAGVPVDGVAILREIEARHGILVQCAHQIYTFAHLTFQEYYTARYTVDNARRDTLKRLLHHVTEARWREVILLTASMLDEADDFFTHFLDALDEIVRNDATLVDFLTWVQRKVETVTAPYKPAATRAYYAWLDRALDRDLALARALDLDLDLTRALDRALDRDLTRGLTRALTRDLTRTLALDRALARARAQELKLDTLCTALDSLSPPAKNAPSETWRAFANNLQAVMIEHRDIGHDWNFTEAQVETLARYFTAAHLLVECLDVAYVTDRAAIEDRLLLPPEPKSSTQ